MKINYVLVIIIVIIAILGSIKMLNKGSIQNNREVEDNTPPVINLNSEENIVLAKGNEYVQKVTATDDMDGDVTSKITTNGTVNTDVTGIYEIEYRVEDSHGNKAEAKQQIEVREELKNGLPVLMYHFFYSKDDPNYAGKTPDNNLLMIEKFGEQLDYLVENNYYYPTWQEVIDYVDGKIKLPERSIVLTDDDGNHTFFALAVPVCEEKKVPITSFVITGEYEDRLHEKYNYVNYQSHSDDMHKGGGNGKGAMVNLSLDGIIQDLNTSKSKIEVATGNKCNVFCYPFGHYNDTAEKALNDTGFDLAFTVEGGRVKVGANKLELPRVRINGNITTSQFKESVK